MADANSTGFTMPEYESGTEYIAHHLGFLRFGQKADGSWGIAHSVEEADAMGFWAINVDSMLMSLLLGVIFMGLFYFVSRRATSGIPGGLQNAVEAIVEMVQTTVKSTFFARNDLIGPLALTIFCWIFMMNLMDLVPVDWIPLFAQVVAQDSHLYFKAVPTTDLNITAGFALSVFVLVIFYSIKIKGAGGFLGEAGIPGAATVRQHVRRRNDLHGDCDGWLVPAATAFCMGGVPHPHHHLASVSVHDADNSLSEPGTHEARGSLNP